MLGIILFLFSLSANAALHTYDLVYTSATTAATGTGFITIDDAVYPNDGTDFLNQPAATIGITAFSITISGAVAGNGTFGLVDIQSFIWTQSTPYNLSMELVAQAAHTDFNLGNLNPIPTPGVPIGTAPNTITTNFGGARESLILRSMTPSSSTAVPTLSFWGLGLMILLLPFVARRRIK